MAYKLVGSGLLLNDKVSSGGDVSTLQRRIAMIQTSQVHHCRECGSAHLVRNGHNRCGSQQYQCRECGASKVLLPKQRHSGECKARCCGPARSAPRCGDPAEPSAPRAKTITRWLKKTPDPVRRGGDPVRC